MRWQCDQWEVKVADTMSAEHFEVGIVEAKTVSEVVQQIDIPFRYEIVYVRPARSKKEQAAEAWGLRWWPRFQAALLILRWIGFLPAALFSAGWFIYFTGFRAASLERSEDVFDNLGAYVYRFAGHLYVGTVLVHVAALVVPRGKKVVAAIMASITTTLGTVGMYLSMKFKEWIAIFYFLTLILGAVSVACRWWFEKSAPKIFDDIS